MNYVFLYLLNILTELLHILFIDVLNQESAWRAVFPVLLLSSEEKQICELIWKMEIAILENVLHVIITITQVR
jgi:hypothetical protein